MGSENRRLALLGFNLDFGTDDAIAEAAGTRTWVQGSDLLHNVAHALSTGPGRVNQTALQMFRDAQNPQSSTGGDKGQSDKKGTYDCATDTCSNGKALYGITRPFRALACQMGVAQASLNGLCDPKDNSGVLATDGGAQGGANPFDPFGRYNLPADAFKRVAFLLLALVLIYAGVRALS